MKILAGSKKLRAEEVTYFEHGFGRLEDLIVENYTIYIPVSEFILKIEKIYDQCINELIDDDQQTKKFYPPYPGAKSYPTLQQFISIGGESWVEFVDTFLKFDIYSVFFNEGVEEAKYRIASFEDIKINNNFITIVGKITKI